MSEHDKRSAGLIEPHGGYRELKSYQKAELVYDAPISFCNRFIERRSRTHDQMVQAARSGKQNIAEGSTASGTSRKRNSSWSAWHGPLSKNCCWISRTFCDNADSRSVPKTLPAQVARKLAYLSNRSYTTYRSNIEEAAPEVAANTLICLIHQTDYLLDQQLRQLEERFLKEGGFTERLYKKRRETRRY